MRLIDRLGYRVGGERYLQENGSRGIATLATKNVDLDPSNRISIHFRGKGGRQVETLFTDPLVAPALQACHELPGQRLFTYRTGRGETGTLTSDQVNQYLAASYHGVPVSAKSLRTWRASAITVDVLRSIRRPADRESEFREAVEAAASAIANRYTTCRKHYVDPRILEAYRKSGRFGLSRWQIPARRDLRQAESLLLRILRETPLSAAEPA